MKKPAVRPDSNLFGALAYFLFIATALPIYFLKERDSFVKFHAIQSILLTIVAVVAWIAISIVSGILYGFTVFFQPFGLAARGFSTAAWLAYQIIVFILWLLLMYKAFSGERYKLPLIGEQAEQYVE